MTEWYYFTALTFVSMYLYCLRGFFNEVKNGKFNFKDYKTVTKGLQNN